MRISDWISDVCSSDLLALRIAHLAFGEREVAIAPHAEYGQGRRTVMTRQHLPDIGAIPVEAGGQSSGPRQSGDPRIGFRRIVDQLAYRKPVARGEQSLREAAHQEDVDVTRTPFLLEAEPVIGGLADKMEERRV